MFSRLKKEEKGQVLIIAIVLFLIGTAFSALVVDAGMLYADKRKVQNAVDAAALSGTIVAAKEEGNVAKVHEEVDKYLKANLDKDVLIKDIQIDMTEPISVTVDATTDYPTFFARIFQKERVDIAGHAKAEYIEFNLPDFPYTLFSEDEIIIMNGNKQQIVGPIYSKKDSRLDLDKVTIKDSDSDKNRSSSELIETAATGIVEMPDYSSIISSAKKMTYREFDQTYLSGQKEMSGVIEISDRRNVELRGTIKGKGVIYSSGNMDLKHLQSYPGSSILFYSDGNVVSQKLDFYGTIYAPNGSVEFNGDPNNSGYGKILARDRLEFNGAKFSLEAYPAADDWMTTLTGGSRLIE